MARAGSPLGEVGAWLLGFIAPVGGLVFALSLALASEADGGAPRAAPPPGGAGNRVAGASLTVVPTAVPAAVPTSIASRAPTSTPRDALSGPLLTAPAAPASGAPAAVPRNDIAVAGVQMPAAPAFQSSQAAGGPLIGRVGGHAVPAALPVGGIALALAGLALRLHTSARWTSNNWRWRCVTSTRRRSRSSSSSSRTT